MTLLLLESIVAIALSTLAGEGWYWA